MGNVSAADLDRVTNFEQLVALLRDKLDWPIGENYGFDDVVFEYEASELGLKQDEVAKIREIHQLRPLTTNQPWGVFFISMEEKALPVTVLRRILKALVVRKRAMTGDRRAWDKNDLIFAASFGASGARELAFIHFSDGKATGDMPVMKVLGWNARDTVLKHEYVAAMLRDKLSWPEDPHAVEAWRDAWSSAFELRLNQTIRTSKELAVRLAELASDIRARVNQLLNAEDDTGPMRRMLAAFRKNLIHDLNEDGFADMFAQTIAYGLLAARISRPMGIIADNLSDMVPKTNPFLKELFGSFLKIGGRDKRWGLDFDELGIRDVVDALNTANMEAVLRDFGDRNPKEDPVIHFYELFLKEYDPKKRMQRGVFYTPRPVVNFIVRGVDEILRTEFGLPLGLADTSTWGEVVARNERITIPAHIKPDAPFVQILDPATGTGTFLVEVIDLIHRRMEDHWRGQGKSAAEVKAAWNAYVPAHLLPRLTAFELMMAPYTIAHMKVGLKLSETGYAFGSEERARIFLTNALEPARDLDMEFIFMSEALAHEAQASNESKVKTPFTVVIGNPPYSISSSNSGSWIRGLISNYKKGLETETNLQPISDDYVKFFALGEAAINRTKFGCVSFVSNHTYLNGIILRGMRRHLIENFSRIDVVDLHGSVLLGLSVDTQMRDENVFDIQQGVGIFRGVKIEAVPASDVGFGEIILPRLQKFDRLLESTFGFISRERVLPRPDRYLFIPSQVEDASYQAWRPLSGIFVSQSTGLETGKDDVLIQFDERDMLRIANYLDDPNVSTDQIVETFGLQDTSGWNVKKRRLDLNRRSRTSFMDSVRKITYRPFDQRFSFVSSFIRRAQFENMKHLVGGNIGLVATRQIKGEEPAHVLVSDQPIEKILISPKTSNNAFLFPLFLIPSVGEPYRRPNIDRIWALGLGEALGLTYEDGIFRGGHRSFGDELRRSKAEQFGQLDVPSDGRGDLQKTFGPRDLFDYIYAVLHSPGYRSRYAEFLKSDFPRIPTPATRTTFAALAALGRQLVGLHLLRPEDAPILKSPHIRFAGSGEARVEKGFPDYTNGKVMINASRWFEDVPKATWEFHVGGYQVCEKWLKDRAGKGGKNPGPGRVLTEEDILHYRRIVVALTETRRLMAEIDKAIDQHGGWPGAFIVASDNSEETAH